MDESRPPGVSRVIRTAAAPASAASAMPPSTWLAMKGSTTPSIRSSTTWGELDWADAGDAASASPASRIPKAASGRRRMPFISQASSHHATHEDASERAADRPASNASEHGIMTKALLKAPGGAAGVYLEGDRVSNRPEGPLLAREEQQLVEGLLAGNEDAVRALYARYARPIFTLGLRLLGSAEAAEELTQDVFLAAWRKAARFDPARGRLSTWLMTIAHNLAVDRLRRETGVTRPHLVLVDEVPEVGWVDEEEPVIERDL